MPDWTIRRPNWETEKTDDYAIPAEWSARGARKVTPKGVARPGSTPKPKTKPKGKKAGVADYAMSIANLAAGLTPESAGRQGSKAGAAIGNFIKDNDLSAGDVGSIAWDVAKELPGAIYDEARGDPLGFAVGLIPGYDAVTGVREGAQLRAEGRADEAFEKERNAAALEAMNFAPLGLLGKGGKRAAKVAPKFVSEEIGNVLSVKPTTLTARTIPAAEKASLSELRAMLRKPELNEPAAVANRYNRETLGKDYDVGFQDPGTSLQKQSGIARSFREAASENPDYKSAIFERYGLTMPDVVESAGAQNYDQLTEAAYRQLAKETKQQFDRLPVEMRYHQGDLEYPTPSAMLQDVLGRGRLNVYRGGDRHPYLSDIDPESGLTGNEMFRAVHDYFGHGTRGTTFRPGGEEVAYASHHQMLSPLAQMALLSETRGQNSLVNYSPLNIELLEARAPGLKRIKQLQHFQKMTGDPTLGAREIADINAQLAGLGIETKFAPQTPVLLPPEYLDPMTKGGMPEYLRPVIRPAAPTGPERAVHLSHTEGLSRTDPSFYGTGHRGEDFGMRGRKGSPREHTSFYLGPEGEVRAEQVVEDVSPYAYETMLKGLYNVADDPEHLVRLARAYNMSESAIPDLTRMVREYGYAGYRNPEFLPGQAAANVFDPVDNLRPIKKGPRGYAEGGAV